MSRSTILVIAAILAVGSGLLVSYFPPPQNATAIWAAVNVFIGYGIRDLFKDEPPAAPPAAPAAAAEPDAPKS